MVFSLRKAQQNAALPFPQKPFSSPVTPVQRITETQQQQLAEAYPQQPLQFAPKPFSSPITLNPPQTPFQNSVQDFTENPLQQSQGQNFTTVIPQKAPINPYRTRWGFLTPEGKAARARELAAQQLAAQQKQQSNIDTANDIQDNLTAEVKRLANARRERNARLKPPVILNYYGKPIGTLTQSHPVYVPPSPVQKSNPSNPGVTTAMALGDVFSSFFRGGRSRRRRSKARYQSRSVRRSRKRKY